MNATANAAPQKAEHWDKIISSKRKLLDLRLGEVWQYRYLIKTLVKRDFVVAYKQTVLGPLWYLVQPLISAVMYAFVFGNVANIGTDGVPQMLFYFAGSMLWTYFSSCLTRCASTFTDNQGVFGKVYFPRIAPPIAVCGYNIIKLLTQCLLLAAIFAYYVIVKKAPVHPTLWALTFPLVILWIGALGGGLGLIVSALTTKYRDLNILLNFGVQLIMYVTPVAYPLSEVPPSLMFIAYANPLSAPIEFFRVSFYGVGSLEPGMVASSLVMTFVFVFLGLVVFTQSERNFVDVI